MGHGGAGAEGQSPALMFYHWREVLNGQRLGEGVRSGYAAAIEEGKGRN